MSQEEHDFHAIAIKIIAEHLVSEESGDALIQAIETALQEAYDQGFSDA